MLRGEDLAGNRLPDSPEFTGNVVVDWEVFRFDQALVAVQVEATYADSQYFEPFNIPRLRQDAYTLLNARLALGSTSGRWEAALWGRNLTDEFYITSAADVSGIGYDYTHRGVPLTYGLELNFKF